MARIIGDYIGTTWNDALVLPGAAIDEKKFNPEDVDISTNIGGVRLNTPFLTAAMRSVTGKELALAAGKQGMMGVAPRGLSAQREVEIVEHVKNNAVKLGEIESEYKPTTALDSENLGSVIEKARRTGHDNIPIVSRKSDFVGMFHYKPSEHDNMDFSTPITKMMRTYRKGGGGRRSIEACSTRMGDKRIKNYLKDRELRFVPVVDGYGRLDRLVFLQQFEGYKVGAAIDTHKGWKKRAEKLVEAGADMIFIDTSDAHKPFSREVIEKYARMVRKYKEMDREYPPICGGNVVTPDAFEYLAKAGADAVKLGMGPGSICSTNTTLGVGAPPLWSLIEVAKRRDAYFKEKGKYIALIADGGIEGTDNINVALTHADAIMGGNIFGCFLESEGDRRDRKGNVCKKGMIAEGDIVAIRIYGEGSKEAMETSGNLDRYTTPLSAGGVTTFQGVSGWVPYKGRFKPGVEGYVRALREALYHAGTDNLEAYREHAVLIRLSERARQIANPHGIDIIGD